jgi:pilus assembly protein Flp/PilA
MYTKLMLYLGDEKGASMVEYSLLVVLIAIVALVAVTVAGGELSETYSEISSNLVDAGS